MFKHNFAEINDVRMHYVSAGAGKLIIFVHGFPEFWYAWKDQLAEFGRDHLAVAPDMRGYNLSSKPSGVSFYRMKLLVKDLQELASHLGHDRFVIVGHDWGGAVAWALAMREPHLLEKLIIINAPHPVIFQRELMQNPAQQKASAYMLTFRSPDAERLLSENEYGALVQIVLGDGLKEGYFTDADRLAYIEAWSQPGALTGGLNYYRAARIGPPEPEQQNEVAPFESEAPLVRVPTLVIWGEKDRALLTGNLEGLESYVPDLTVKRIAEGSHWVIHERPVLVNQYIRDFIEGDNV